MVRVKFLIFAFLAIGLGLAHLFVLSGPMEAQAIKDAQAQVGAGTAEVVRTLEARRGIARALGLKLAGNAELVSAAQEMTGPEAPAAERFAALRAAAEAALPKDLQGVVIGVATESGAWHARAGGEPSADTAALDVKALTQADAPSVVEAFGAPHAFATVPLVWKFVRIPGAERLEVQLAATLVVGVPLLPEGALDGAAVASGVPALELVKDQTVVASGGPQKGLIEGVRSSLKEGEPAQVVKRGQVSALGPVKLPVLTTGKDFLGGQAPLLVGSRRALEGTPYEVIALISPRLMVTLADYQRNALFGLAGLLGVSLLWTVIMGAGKRAASAPEEVRQGGDTLGLGNAMHAMPPQEQAPIVEALPEAPPVTHPGLELTGATPYAEPAPSASGEFPFGPPPQAYPDAYAAEPPPPAADPFAFPPPPEPQAHPQAHAFGPAPVPFDADALPPPPDALPPPVATASPRAGAFAFEEIPTAAYSLQQAADPYAAASAMDDNPETTRVAAIPRELLQASVRPVTQEMPVAPPRPATPPPHAPSVAPVPWNTPEAQAIPLPGSAYQAFMGNTEEAFSEEDYHFQEVFREFVLTRERCLEPSDGLTYDKFVQKLRKNKEQLMSKYTCRTVRFQVYVKEGKAALKATPVKD
ncbi:MXAN_5187 family protein [Hyalangium rubrum]|uniref:MXAN_5187 family protein n=1 Tax=Hyalangium rubrum TaxID=3103134 RepID=A0ABU5HB48_9BACT|nr:MXAN_5187 family protein [Hyalangium sp. s54d21]MDY7230520.1 MXAN_5187 family protein [Hyalangium sp. s54d21]